MSKRGNGEGSIYQMADGRWRAAISVGWKNGKRARKVFTADTRREVQEDLTKALRARQLGFTLAPEKQNLEQFLAWWMKEIVTPTVRPKTLKFYEFISRMHLIPGIGKRPLAKLSPQEIQTFLNERLASGLAPRTVRHIHRTLCTALECAVKYGNAPRNAATLVDPPRVPKGKIRFFTMENARAFLDAAKADRLYALFATVLSIGLRLGEALGLNWSDFDIETGKLTVNGALQRVKGEMKIVEAKSASSRRTITLPAVAISALARHRSAQDQERQLAGTAWKGDRWNLIFCTSVGTPTDERNALRRFQNILAAAELPKMRIHDLRHSAASILIAQGVSAKAISELLGHSSVAFTLQVYGHLMEDTRREVAARMDDALNPVATKVATKREPKRLN